MEDRIKEGGVEDQKKGRWSGRQFMEERKVELKTEERKVEWKTIHGRKEGHYKVCKHASSACKHRP